MRKYDVIRGCVCGVGHKHILYGGTRAVWAAVDQSRFQPSF